MHLRRSSNNHTSTLIQPSTTIHINQYDNYKQQIIKNLHLYNDNSRLREKFNVIDVKGDGLCGFYAYIIATTIVVDDMSNTTNKKINLKNNDIIKRAPSLLCSKIKVEALCQRLRHFLVDSKHTALHQKIMLYEGQKQDMLRRIGGGGGGKIANMELDILHALAMMDNVTICVYYDGFSKQKNPWIILNPNCANVGFIRQTGHHYMVLQVKKLR